MEITVHQNRPETHLKSDEIKKLCKTIAAEIKLSAESCAVIFVDDSYLAEMHGQYLDDSNPTDIITFNLGSEKIEGELYISIDRALEQAEEFGVSAGEEVYRLIIHGLLHLKGYNDTKPDEKSEMKRLEDKLVHNYCKKR